MNDVIERYLDDIKKNLYNLVPSDDFLEEIRQNLLEYIRQFPETTYPDLVELFGTPEDVAAEFIDSRKPKYPRERAASRNKLRVFIFILLAIIVLLASLIVVASRDRQAMYTDVTTETEPVEILEPEEISE